MIGNVSHNISRLGLSSATFPVRIQGSSLALARNAIRTSIRLTLLEPAAFARHSPFAAFRAKKVPTGWLEFLLAFNTDFNFHNYIIVEIGGIWQYPPPPP